MEKNYPCIILNKKRNGTITDTEKKSINVFKNWCENSYKIRPIGSIVIQSTTAHSWPYPALLYKRGVKIHLFRSGLLSMFYLC